MTVDSNWISEALLRIENKYGIKLASLLVFVAVGDILVGGIENYLQIEFELSPAAAKSVKNDLQTNVLDPLLRRLNFLNSYAKKEMTVKEEKAYLLEIFSSGLVREISEHPVICEAVNARIFNIFSQDLQFKDSLEKAIYMNGELLTHALFEIGAKPQSPTIGNWIQDFIGRQGSGLFDNLQLTRYITESENVKRLSDSEKLIIGKLLNLYRNLKFFPESMPSDDVNTWEIIPVDMKNDNMKNPRKPIGPPKTEEEKRIEELKREKEAYGADALERLAIEEEIGKKKRLEDLKFEANKYPAGTFERMAVEEEIGRLGSKK